jgi:hypothetical protein
LKGVITYFTNSVINVLILSQKNGEFIGGTAAKSRGAEDPALL